MGVFSALGASRAVERLKSGKSQSEVMSTADIMMLSVNMLDAYKNLPQDQYKEVQELFDVLKKNTAKKSYSLEDYLDAATVIMCRFDAIAPFEMYCGSTEMDAYLRNMKQNPSYYVIRDMVLNNPDFLSAARAIREAGAYSEDVANGDMDEENDETNKEIVDEDDFDSDNDDDNDSEVIIRSYEYKESYVYFTESEMYSEAFDAELNVDIFLYDDSDCHIMFDEESFFGTWKHEHDDLYDFSGFDDSNKVILRGLSEYYVKCSDDELIVLESDPQIKGIRFKHVFIEY